MTARLTTQLHDSSSTAFLAYSFSLKTRGPNGEMSGSLLLETSNTGRTWNPVPFRRTFWDRMTHFGYPTWPPEAITAIERADGRLSIIHRDEWVPYEPGGESLWRSIQSHNRLWRTVRIRYMDYENSDSPGSLPTVEWNLPEQFESPSEDLIAMQVDNLQS